MLPCRGLSSSSQLAGLRRTILPQTPISRLGSSRYLSTALRSHGRASTQSASLMGALSSHRISQRTSPTTLQSRFSPAQQSRYNSTTPASSAAATSSPPVGSTPLDIDLDAAAFLDMPAQIGYLHAMGIDFGYGTSTLIQTLFEYIHVYSGLPWWASIAAIPVIFRVLIFKPALDAAQQQAKMGEMNKDPRYVAAIAKNKEALFKEPRDIMGGAQARSQMAMVRKEYNINFVKMFLPMLQVPIGFGMFRLTRAMAALPVPGMETGGLLWFTDLTIPDPTFILPVVSAASMFFMMKTSLKYMPPESQKMMKFMQYVITPIVLISTIQMASAVTWMLLISTTLQIFQNTLFHTPAIRRMANLPPLQTTEQQAASRVYGLHSTYQAPRRASALNTTATAVAPEPPKSKNPWAEMRDSYRELKEKASETMAGNKDEAHVRKAQEYEKRRALEDQEAHYRRLSEAKRAQQQKRGGQR